MMMNFLQRKIRKGKTLGTQGPNTNEINIIPIFNLDETQLN